jgi:hypothetical protein
MEKKKGGGGKEYMGKSDDLVSINAHEVPVIKR